MDSKQTRLDRFISQHMGINRKDVRFILAQKRVHVDNKIATDINQLIGQFTSVTLDKIIIRQQQAIYLMLHKPAGFVSATKDQKHKTVIDLIDQTFAKSLHIVGRLDFNSTGLLLLTNDGRWSRALTSPGSEVTKTYHVTVQHPLNESYRQAFAKGFYFKFEDITTQAAQLEIVDAYNAVVHLTEGRYHQIKRMFGYFNNPVLRLHRVAIGNISLDKQLTVGAYRLLTPDEIKLDK